MLERRAESHSISSTSCQCHTDRGHFVQFCLSSQESFVHPVGSTEKREFRFRPDRLSREVEADAVSTRFGFTKWVAYAVSILGSPDLENCRSVFLPFPHDL